MGAPSKKTSLRLDENFEALLAYLLGWVTGIIFLALERESRFVRFHAAQSLAVFLPLFVAMIILSAIPFIGWIFTLLTLLLWLFLMFKAFQGEKYKLPVAGDFAEKQSSL